MEQVVIVTRWTTGCLPVPERVSRIKGSWSVLFSSVATEATVQLAGYRTTSRPVPMHVTGGCFLYPRYIQCPFPCAARLNISRVVNIQRGNVRIAVEKRSKWPQRWSAQIDMRYCIDLLPGRDKQH